MVLREGERERDLEIWYIALAHRQARCCQLFSLFWLWEGRKARECVSVCVSVKRSEGRKKSNKTRSKRREPLLFHCAINKSGPHIIAAGLDYSSQITP